jgi:hypothetical protein
MPGTALGRGSSRAAHGPSGSQVLVQVSAQMTTALDVERLVDGLGAHLHLHPVRERRVEVIADLLGAPLQAQLGLHHRRQLGVLKLTRLGPPAA